MEANQNLLFPSNEKIIRSLHRVSIVGSLIIVGLGIACLIGWSFSLPIFVNFFPHVIGMNPLTAVGFICIGVALFLQIKHQEKPPQWVVLSVLLLSWLALLIGCVTVYGYLTDRNVGLDQVLFHALLAGNRISPNSGVSFMLTSLAILLLQFHTKKHFTRFAQLLTLVVALISMFGVLGYVYQSFVLYKITSLAPMPLSSALTFTILCIVLLASRLHHGFTTILTRNTPSSLFAFRLILIALTLPALLGYLSLLGSQLHFYDSQTAIALSVVGNILLFTIIIWFNASGSQRLELENIIIKNELEKKNIRLEVDANQLSRAMLRLEEEKQEAYDTLTYKNTLMDLVEKR